MTHQHSNIQLPKFDTRRRSETSVLSPTHIHPAVQGSQSISPRGTNLEMGKTIQSPNPDNPFQDDKLPLWQAHRAHVSELEMVSSPEANQDKAYDYSYKILNETPLSPMLNATRRLANQPKFSHSSRNSMENVSTAKSPIIQACLSDFERQILQHKIKKKRGETTNFSKEESELLKPDSEDENLDDVNETENFKTLKGDVIEIQVKRNKYGLGLALAGHKDRNRMGTFICGIHPDGPVAQDGRLKPGDELLKIHQTVVRGRCHLNVSAIIKNIPPESDIRVVALRSNNNLEKVAVKNFNHFPLLLEEVIFSSPEFDDFKAKREIKIHKATEGIGIMIIEGSHKLLGKGIYVSDIQNDSLAQNAGLRVGDMILAVNTESFLTVNYDEASLILKQVTGFVRMLVVNPADESLKRSHSDDQKIERSFSPNFTKIDGHMKTPQISPAKSQAPTILSTALMDDSKSPTKSLVKSPAKTFLKSPIKSPTKIDTNKIELRKDSNGLGLSIVGGSDTPLGGIIVHEVYKNGAADKDGRLQPGDRILSVNGTAFNELTHEDALRILRTSQDKVIIVTEPKSGDAADIYQDLEVELHKKPGKGLGLSVVGRRDGNGVFISDMVSGGVAEANGQLLRGDQIMSVNGKDLSQAGQDQAVAVLKTVSGFVKLKVRRYKFVTA